MKNIVLEIDKLTYREKELFIYYVIGGISEDSKNNYIAYTETSRAYLNQLTHSLKNKGFLIKEDNGFTPILKINN